MTREELKEMMPIIQTYVNGNKIEIFDKEDKVETNEMNLDNNDSTLTKIKKE